MGIFSGKNAAVVPDEAPRPKTLVASALRFRFDDASYNNWRFRDEAWQRELWRLYDITPELRFAASWVGSCCSRVRIYVARVDELGRVQGEVKNPKIAALSDTLLGGPTQKAEHLRMMGIDLTIAGECYIIGRPGDDDSRDRWYVVTPTEFRRIKGSNGEWDWAWDGPGNMPLRLDLQNNVVTRVWTPHPLRVWCADSPARSCQMILRELEQLTKYVASQIDSRLIGAGILIIPNDLDLPQEENLTNNADSLMYRLATAGAASLRGEGTALGVLPHIIEAANAEGFKLLDFSSELSKQALELRKEAIERLGVGMDMPPEVLTGVGDTNHWSGFLIDGYGIKVHIAPLMNRICEALTVAYLNPALKLMGLDPKRYTYAFDTAPLELRPQRLQDALNLYEKRIIGPEAVIDAANFKTSDAMTTEEAAKLYIQEILLRDPQMFQNAAVRKAAGIPESIIPQESMIAPTAQSIGLGAGGGSGPPPPPVPPTGIQSELPPAIPDTLGDVGAPPTQPGGPVGRPPNQRPTGPPPTGLTASAASLQEMGIVVLAEASVRRGLELAGKRLLDADNRHRWPDVPCHELHTRIKVKDQARVNRLLSGAWKQLPEMTKFVADDFDHEKLQRSLEKYCSFLLLHATAHEPSSLFNALKADGVIHAQ